MWILPGDGRDLDSVCVCVCVCVCVLEGPSHSIPPLARRESEGRCFQPNVILDEKSPTDGSSSKGPDSNPGLDSILAGSVD